MLCEHPQGQCTCDSLIHLTKEVAEGNQGKNTHMECEDGFCPSADTGYLQKSDDTDKPGLLCIT